MFMTEIKIFSVCNYFLNAAVFQNIYTTDSLDFHTDCSVVQIF